MKKIRAILVDDEERARDVLENLLTRFCPNIELLGKFSKVIDAVSFLKQNCVDVVFIDIEMPEYAGYELVRFFDQVDFSLVFVTAYDQYAVRAFELSAVDYLLKPVEVERLQIAVGKVSDSLYLKQQKEKIEVLKETFESKELSTLVIAEKNLQHVVELSSIVAFEAQESYTIIHLQDKRFMASKNLKHFENLLDSSTSFFRSHKSWMINMDYFESYSKSLLDIQLKNGMSVKLSKYKKAEFEALFNAIS